LHDWLNKPLAAIDRGAIRERHKRIAAEIAAGKHANGRSNGERTGYTTANHVMHALRAIW